jgi:hypothetical protein
MRFRATPPPELIPARLGGAAPLTGAAEDAFAAVLTDDGLRAWTARPRTGASRTGASRTASSPTVNPRAARAG